MVSKARKRFKHLPNFDFQKIDLRELSAKHKRNISVSDEPLKTSGGVIVSNLDDTISVNNTIEARLERMKAELRTDIVNKFK